MAFNKIVIFLPDKIPECNTEIRYKAGPMLRDLVSSPPLAAGASSRNLFSINIHFLVGSTPGWGQTSEKW